MESSSFRTSERVLRKPASEDSQRSSLSARSLPRGGSNQVSKLPQYALWAWERPEDLRFINPQNTAVAFLSNTIHLHSDAVVVRPRLQPPSVS
jgi:hypothetical protein